MRVGSFKRVIARLAVVMVAVGAPAMVTATPAQAQFVSVNAAGYIYNSTSYGLTMAVENGDVVNSSTPARQVWWVQDNAPNGHIIYHATGCLDTNRWTEVYMLGCNGGDYQRWHMDKQADGWYRIQNKATGDCLAMSVPDPKIAYTSDCRDTANQKFLIVN